MVFISFWSLNVVASLLVLVVLRASGPLTSMRMLVRVRCSLRGRRAVAGAVMMVQLRLRLSRVLRLASIGWFRSCRFRLVIGLMIFMNLMLGNRVRMCVRPIFTELRFMSLVCSTRFLFS